MPARRPTAHKTVGGIPIAHEPMAGAATPVPGELVTLKAQGPKPGWATTEFWITLAPLVGAALTVFHVTAAPAQVRDALIVVAGVVGAAYALSRGIVKAAHTKATTARQLPVIDSEAGASRIGVVLFVVAVLLLAGLLGAFVHHAFFLLIVLLLLLFFA